MFGYAVFGWDAFAQNWQLPQSAPTVVIAAIPGGHRRKWAKRSRKLTDAEREALDAGFRERIPKAPEPDLVPVYLSPRAPVASIGLGAEPAEPDRAPTLPSVIAALFDATATDRQRLDAFTFFDRLETKLDRLARRRKHEARLAYEASIQEARAIAEQRIADYHAEQVRKQQADEDEMMSLLLMLHEDE